MPTSRHVQKQFSEFRREQTGISATPDLGGGWEVSPSMGVIPIGPRSVGKRVSESSAAWQAPRAGHPLGYMMTRDIPDATPPPLDPLSGMSRVVVYPRGLTSWRYQPSGGAPRGPLSKTAPSYRPPPPPHFPVSTQGQNSWS